MASHSHLPLTPLLNPHADVRDIAFSPDERQVLMITSDRRVLSWDIAAPDIPLEEMAAQARLLTGRVLDATGALVPREQALEGAVPKHLAPLLPPSLNGTNMPSDGPSRARSILRPTGNSGSPRAVLLTSKRGSLSVNQIE